MDSSLFARPSGPAQVPSGGCWNDRDPSLLFLSEISPAREGRAMRLDELAIAIRSKNAGPCMLTLDIIFASDEAFSLGCDAVPRLQAFVSERYARPLGVVRIFRHPPSRAIKVTMPRERISGSVGDRDVYGAQQHGPLLEFQL